MSSQPQQTSSSRPRRQRRRKQQQQNVYIPGQPYTPPQQQSRRNRRRRRYRRRYRVPSAFAFKTVANSTLRTMRGGSVRLYCHEQFAVWASTNDKVTFALPITPSKWQGTRTAQLCSTFSSHRPIYLRMSWKPTVGTTTEGSIAFGTIFAGNKVSWNNLEEAQRALTSSNGGFLATVYLPSGRNVQLGTSLTQNTYPLNNIDPDDIPFWILGTSTLTSGNIGHLVIDAVFSLTNPIASNISPLPSTQFVLTATHDADNDTTTMSLPKSNISSTTIAEGDTVWLAPLRNVINLAGSVLAQILEPILARVTYSGDNYILNVDKSIASQTIDLCLGGRPSTNFR